MTRLYFYCEGQTEESFVKHSLAPIFWQKEILVIPIICRTKEGPQGVFKGGLVDYNKAVKEVHRYCTEHPHEAITSFIDYYGLKNLPSLPDIEDKYELIDKLENQFAQDVNCGNFIPYISLHEFESLLFSNPEEFRYLNEDAVQIFEQVLQDFNGNPELINNGIQTAPSKRILNVISNYGKVLDGNRIANRITLPVLRQKCRHFSEWLDKLENINL